MGSAISGGEPQARPLELPATAPLIRVMAMPADANPNGDIFGGWLLAQMDLAGGNLAVQRRAGGAPRWRSTAWSFTSRFMSAMKSAVTANWSRPGVAR